MKMTEQELRQLIETHVRKQLKESDGGRTLLRLPNTGSVTNPSDLMDMEPPVDNMEQPPIENNPNMEEKMPPQTENPYVSELVELLNANPDRAEGVLKYAKGIIGNDNVPGDTTGTGVPDAEEQTMTQPSMGENRTFDLDEMISSIITGSSTKKNKPTITRPIGTVSSIKGKMFRPIMGSS